MPIVSNQIDIEKARELSNAPWPCLCGCSAGSPDIDEVRQTLRQALDELQVLRARDARNEMHMSTAILLIDLLRGNVVAVHDKK